MAFPSRGFVYPETEEKAITTQHQNEGYLLLDSFDRFALTPNGNYDTGNFLNVDPSNYTINHQTLNGFGQIKKVALTEYFFPWNTPNVNIRNQYFFLEVSTGEFIYIVVPEDFYTPVELAQRMQLQLNNNLKTNYPIGDASTIGTGAWVVTTNPKTDAFTISNPGVTFILEYPDNAPNETIDTLIGITGEQTPDFVNSVTGIPPSMAYTQYIDVCSNSLTKFQTLKDSLTQFNYTNIICRIYLTSGLNQPGEYFGARPSVLYRQIKDPKYMKWNIDQMISGIDIHYRDDSGNTLYIPNVPVSSNSQIFTLKLVEHD
jgi:hypothetical protein